MSGQAPAWVVVLAFAVAGALAWWRVRRYRRSAGPRTKPLVPTEESPVAAMLRRFGGERRPGDGL
jgi:hypothetical protein